MSSLPNASSDSDVSSVNEGARWALFTVCLLSGLALLLIPKAKRFAQGVPGAFCFAWMFSSLFTESKAADVVAGLAISGYIGFVIFLRMPRQMAPLGYVLAFFGVLHAIITAAPVTLESRYITVIRVVGSIILLVLLYFFPKHMESMYVSTVGGLFIVFAIDCVARLGIIRSFAQDMMFDVKQLENFVDNVFPEKDTMKHQTIRLIIVSLLPPFSVLYTFSHIVMNKMKRDGKDETQDGQNPDSTYSHGNSARRRKRAAQQRGEHSRGPVAASQQQGQSESVAGTNLDRTLPPEPAPEGNRQSAVHFADDTHTTLQKLSRPRPARLQKTDSMLISLV